MMTSPAEKLKILLRDSVLDICRNQLTFYLHLEIRAQLEVIVDNRDSLNVYINETVKSLRGQRGEVQKNTNLACHNPSRSIIEGALLQGSTDGAKSSSGMMQLIKKETENSLTDRALLMHECKESATEWVVARGLYSEIGPTEGRQLDHGLGLVQKPSRVNMNQLDDGQVLSQSQVKIQDVSMIQLPPSCQLAERDKEFNELDQSDVNFNTSDDPKHGAFNSDCVTNEPDLEAIADNDQSEVHQNSSTREHKRFRLEDVTMLTMSTQLAKENGLYKCPKCEFSTEHGSAMNAHIKAHEKTIPCDYCSEMFSSATVLKQHLYDEHGISKKRKLRCSSDKLGCKYCSNIYQTAAELSNHLSKEHGQEALVCPYCDYVSEQASNLHQHIMKHCTGGSWKCEPCGVLFSDGHQLKLHAEQMHGTSGETVCELCGVSVKGPLALKGHIEAVHNRHRCVGCGFSSPRLETMERHKCSDDKNKLCCQICLRTDFVCITQLKKHIRQQHPIDHRRRQCDFCDKVFCSRQGLYTHRKVVHASEVDGTKREVFTCHVCGKGFPIFKYLKGHLKSHENSEPYECPKCHKTFKYHRNFKTHKQGCFNPSGYPCPICSKALKNEYCLKVHISGVHMSRAADKFPCRKCGMPFSHVPTRISHEKYCASGTMSDISA